jgi:type IX secretion system PorP/SprF family membrane protein
MKNILYPLLLILFVYHESKAQQDPHYTQYMYNLSVINPAYAGSKENLSGGLLYRKQWVGIEDTPTTGTFFLHSPVGKNVGMGISAITDKIGPVEENNLYGDFSYTLKLGGEKRLALGIKTGITFHKIDFNTIYPTLPDPEDDVFAGANPSSASFNVGTGLFFYTNRFYLSLSIPNLLKTKYLDFNGISYGSEVSHYFVTTGYVFDLSESIKLKPFALVKTAFNTPVSIDVSTNFLFYNKFEIGATYRLEDSFGAMVNYAITPNLRIGYAYDKIVSDLKVTTPASHEVILLFNLNFSKKVSQSARYF